MNVGNGGVPAVRLAESLVIVGFTAYALVSIYLAELEQSGWSVIIGLSTDIIGLLISLIIFGSMAFSRFATRRNEQLMLLFVIASLTMFFDSATYLLDGDPDNRLVLQTEYYFLYVLVLTLSVLTLRFFRVDKDLDPKVNRYSNITTAVLAFLALALIAANWSTGIIFTIDDEGFYHCGDHKFVFYVLIYMIYGVVLVNELNYQRSLRRAIIWVVVLVFCIMLMMLQYFFWNFTMICVCQFLVLMAIYANRYISGEKVMALRRHTIEEKKHRDMMEQIRPEFLVPVLSSIARMEGNSKEAAEGIEMFRTYLEENIRSCDLRDTVPFTREADHVEMYLRLEKIRFKDRLDYELDLEDTSFSITPLALQMIVENAVRNGITMKPNGGKVTVTSRKVRGGHLVTVEDDGVGFDTSILKGRDRVHGGIQLTSESLYNCLGGKLTVKSEVEKGTRVEMFIPE